MFITVNVKTRANKNEVIKISETEFMIKTTAVAHNGKANEAVIENLANHLAVKKLQITMLKGLKNKVKKLQITI